MKIATKKINKYCIKFTIVKDEKEIGKAYLNILSNDEHEHPFGIVNEISMPYEAIKNGMGEKFVEAIKDEAIARKCYRLTVISEHYKKGVNNQLSRSHFGRHGIEFRIEI